MAEHLVELVRAYGAGTKGASLGLVIPSSFKERMNISKGDRFLVTHESETRLIYQKVTQDELIKLLKK